MALTPGTRLGAYEITAQIGAGGMGEVYRATDSHLKRSVAIKVLPTAVAGDADRLARFQREAEVLAALNHPNIAAIYGFEKTADLTALVMELVEGEDLSAMIARGPIALSDTLSIARQIADALDTAHEQGIIHRDLKPANIKVRADGTVKVLDFGLAKAMDPSSGSIVDPRNSPTLTAAGFAQGYGGPVTQMGVILGTAAYMAPEQARGRAVDQRADIWAFGVVAYEMLSGRRAFDGDDVSITLANVLKEDVRWDALPADLPPPIGRLLRRCLEKDPKRRLRAIGDARIELDDASASAGRDVVAAPRPAMAATPAWRRAIPVLLAILLATAVGVLAWTLKPAPPVKNVVSRFEYVLPADQAFLPGGNHHIFAISADGTKIAYVANRRLYLRAMDQLDALPIRGADDDPSEPVFSPAGDQIAYFARAGSTSGEYVLRKVPVSGGTPLTICKTAGTPSGASWSNGLIVFGQYSGTKSSIETVADSGGTSPRALVTIDPADGRPEQPQLIDGGARVLFTLIPSGVAMSDEGRVVVQAIDGGARTVVLTGGINAELLSNGQIVYVHGGTLFVVPFDARRSAVAGGPVPIIEGVQEEATGGAGKGDFAVSAEGTLVFLPRSDRPGASLVWVDRHGQEQLIAAPPKQYSYPRLSPDGTKLAVGQRDGDFDIWIWDFTKDQLSQLTSGPENKQYPQWMPDSRRVLYRSIAAGGATTSILRKVIDGTGPVETLLDEANGGQPNSMAPDGSLLVYRTATPPYDLRVLPLDGNNRSRPLLADPKFSKANGEVSPDGRWIAYQSNEAGSSEVFVRPFPDVDRGRWQVSAGGGRTPLWARSGGELYFESLSPSRLMAVSIPPIPPNAAFAFGRPQPLFDFTPYRTENVGRMYDEAADGRFVAVKQGIGNAAATRRQALVIVSHWFDELKAGVK